MKEQKIMRRFNYVLSFLLPRLSFDSNMVERSCTPIKGDLVFLTAASPSEWCISIFVEHLGDGEYLLESLQTGKLCRWFNVGIGVLKRSWAADFDRFKWTDEMFALETKLGKAEHKLDLYMQRAYIDAFDGDTARIGIRTRHNFDEHRTTFDVANWQRVTIKRLAEVLAENVARYKLECDAKRQQAVQLPAPTHTQGRGAA